jgi:sulfotransferase
MMTQSTLSLNKQIIYVTGLPRAGSTLLCQLLGHHPHIYSPGHSSPLNQLLGNLRHNLSDNQFLLAQLDVDFDLAYQRLVNAYRGFINGWFAETDRPVVVDKNRGWLGMLDTVNLLDPNFRMIVCLRDLRQIYGSIEAQHQKTLLLDFPDHMAPNSAYARADALLGPEGVIGGPLRSIQNLQDVPEVLRSKLCYVAFEALTSNPTETMRALFRWLELPEARIDPNRLQVKPHESDSYYRFKYRHQTYPTIEPPQPHLIPPRIEQELLKNFNWFFEQFYSEQPSEATAPLGTTLVNGRQEGLLKKLGF